MSADTHACAELSCTDLASRLLASVAGPGSARTAPGLYRSLLRLLAEGRPVGLARLAAAAGLPLDEVEQLVAGWADTEYDEAGAIVGWGISLRPTPHRFIVDGRRLYTWCALDTLFFPAVIGRPARVEAECQASGVPIRLTVDPVRGVLDLDPATAAVSMVTPEPAASVRSTFCDPGRFFASPENAADWVAEHPGMQVLPVAEAFEASRPLSDALLEAPEAGARRGC